MGNATKRLNHPVGLGTTLALLAACLACPQPAARGATAMSDNGFLNSIGANINGSPSGYNPTSLANCCSYLGIRWLRLDTSSNLGNYVSAHNIDTNLKFSVGAGSGGSNLSSMISGGTTLANAGALLAFEGPNEPNNWGITYNGQTSWLAVAEFQTAMYNAVKANSTLKNYPIFGISEDGAEYPNVGLQYATIPAGAGTTLPAGTQYWDYANTHNYVCADGYTINESWNMMNPTFTGYGDPLYGEYGNTWAEHYAGYSNAQLTTLPRVTTETGVEIGTTSNGTTYTADMQAKLLMNTYLDGFAQNVTYTSMFKMADMGNGDGTGWGFLGSSWGTYRESGTDLHNLTTILNTNAAPASAGTVNYSITGEPYTMHDMLLQKGTGVFELCVWNELVSGSNTVTVNLGGTYPTVTIYDPMVGTSAIQTFTNVSSVSLTLSDHPEIIELPAYLPSAYTIAASPGVIRAHIAPGTSSTTITTTLTNTATAAGYGDSLDYTSLGSAAGPGATISATFSGGNLAATDGTANITATQTLSFPSSIVGTFSVTPSAGTVTDHLTGAVATCASTTSATVQVYTGQGTWTGSGTTANWSDYGNWDSTGGAPGVYVGFATGDTATFASGPYNFTVNLDVSPSLTTLTLNDIGPNYTISGTGGGTLILNGNGAAINITGGHVITAPINLASSTTITTTTPDSNLFISGNISGNGTSLTASGPGLVSLSGSNSYSGGTTINAGTLRFARASSLPASGAVSVAPGATLAISAGGSAEFSNATSGNGSIGGVATNTTWSPGSTLAIDTTNAPSGTVTYSAALSGNMGLNCIGTGQLILSAMPTYSGATTISAGTLQTPRIVPNLTIATGATAALTSTGGHNPNASIINGVANLPTIAPGGTLDLTDNGVVITGITSANQSAITDLLTSGQISSSVVADMNSLHPGLMTIAYDFASNIGLNFVNGTATWGGQTISQADAASDLLILPTLVGDLNMDGAVNFTDITALAPNLGKTSGQTWASGDMNGNGAVDFTDVTALAPNLGKTLSSQMLADFQISPAATVTAAPEPASLVLLALGGALLIRRRAR